MTGAFFEAGAVPRQRTPRPIERRIAVAPMMDYTDRHCRYLHRLVSPGALLYTEMVTALAVAHGHADRLLGFDAAESPVALQLGGSDPRDVVIVLNLPHGVVGIAVDGVTDVLTLDAGQIRPAGESREAPHPPFAATIGTRGERRLILLDVEQLMRSAAFKVPGTLPQ